MKNVHKYLEFKLPEEESKNINYLDISIHRINNNFHLGIYRKPTQTDTTIHFISNHPLEHKLSAYKFYVDRMLSTLVTEQTRQQKCDPICTIARNNGFPLQIIHNLRNKVIRTQKT